MNKQYKKIISDYILIIVGCFLLAVSINVFLAPNKISAGGISSIGTILLHLFDIKMSFTNAVLNAILFIFGYKMLGKYSVIQTIAGIIFLSLFLEITILFPVYSKNETIAAIFGGILMGTGVGLVVKTGASTGGSDFAGLILHKIFPHLSLAKIIMVIDISVVILSGIVFKSFTVTAYSIMALFICSVVTEKILVIGNSAKILYIISSKSNIISTHILNEYERGVTGIHSIGMYSGKEFVMLMCIITPKESPKYLSMIKSIDKKAFVVITDANEVLGEGFNEINI